MRRRGAVLMAVPKLQKFSVTCQGHPFSLWSPTGLGAGASSADRRWRIGRRQWGREKGIGMKPTRAISIRQPYVEQILRGSKRIEYRSIPTNIRERVYVYASLKPADDPEAWTRARAKPGDLPTGVIVGTVEIVDCRQGRGRADFQYILARPKRLRKPLRAKNQPQPVFWRPQT